MPIVKINNININYHIFGEGIPLVLISGLGMNHMSWIHQIPVFSNFFKVIVFDNRGIGKSSGSKGQYSIIRMARDVAGLLDYLEIHKSHIVGSSMGGMIAQEFAINYPEKIFKLILCSTFAKQQFIIENISRGIREFLEGNFDNILEVNPNKVIFERFFNFFIKQLFTEEFILKNNKIIEDKLQIYLYNKKYVETFIKQIRAVHKHNTIDRLNLIKADTMIIAGNEDKLINPECSILLAKKIIKSKLIKIDNAGHGFHFERPDIFNKIVLDFLLA